MLMGVCPHRKVIASLAGASIATVDDVLDGKQGGGPRTFPLDVDAVCNGQHPGQYQPRSPNAIGLCPLVLLLWRPQLSCGFKDILWSSLGTFMSVCVCMCHKAKPELEVPRSTCHRMATKPPV
ncbi:hypothetical protein I79_002215 [Cricetulus griseus]|uniref:Uncharacterized protein n=1 Tax=Cricetulus griseus TaxID=10029 RepID=G3GWT4_CRIGR|nr:hypothetical protein I79_002215 [Cricetulus griseus]